MFLQTYIYIYICKLPLKPDFDYLVTQHYTVAKSIWFVSEPNCMANRKLVPGLAK